MTKKIIPLFLVFCLMSSTCFAFSENYTWTTLDGTLETSASTNDLVENSNPLNLEARSAILI